ncbi:MAG: amidohydrolase family protein, partial [Acidobacteria bacterium]|nr:amidohydrolase family protein [Acidobacteriota bacterium]
RWVHAHILNARNDDPRSILSLLRLADEFGFHVATVQHAATAYRVADELAAHGTGASLFGFLIIETPYAAFVLTRRGVTTSLNSDGPRQGRDLNQQAGMLMKTGLTEDEALALVTINPAKQLGIDARVGSIEVGKDADLVVWNHYPLGFLAIADQVFIDGQLYFSRDYDRTRQAWIESERRRLAASGGKITGLRAPAGAEATGSRGMEVDHVR